MSRLFFVSHRTRAPNLFSTETETGKMRQLTDRDDLNEWSAVPSRDGKWLYFTARNLVLRLNIDSLDEETVDCFQGFQAGNCSLSADGSYLAVPVRREGVSAIARSGQVQSRLVLIRTNDGDAQPILE
ncbi:MAG: TolB family protein, partial [Candidatus Bathyarchaeia archaeon]